MCLGRSLLRLVGGLLLLMGCASTGCTLVNPRRQGPVLAPTWRPGDEWAYRWESPQGKGTAVWSIVRVETVDGTEYYVVKSGETGEIYYRKADLAWTMERRDGARVEWLPAHRGAPM
jgi:hypothetical protein